MNMRDYIRSILIVSVITGLVQSLLPSEKMKKHIRFLSSCIVLLLLLHPLVTIGDALRGIYSDVNDLLDRIEAAEQSGMANGEALIQTYGEKAVSDYVNKYLSSEFALDQDEIEVQINNNESDILVTVILRGRASWADGTAIAERLKNKLSCPIKVIRK